MPWCVSPAAGGFPVSAPVRVLRGYWRNVRHGKAGEIRFEYIQSMAKRRKDIVRLIL